MNETKASVKQIKPLSILQRLLGIALVGFSVVVVALFLFLSLNCVEYCLIKLRIYLKHTAVEALNIVMLLPVGDDCTDSICLSCLFVQELVRALPPSQFMNGMKIH